MLVTVVTVFIVCQLPNLGIRIALTAGEFAPRGTVQLDIPALRYANDASNALLTLNSAINFAVYCLVGKKFRRIDPSNYHRFSSVVDHFRSLQDVSTIPVADSKKFRRIFVREIATLNCLVRTVPVTARLDDGDSATVRQVSATPEIHSRYTAHDLDSIAMTECAQQQQQQRQRSCNQLLVVDTCNRTQVETIG